MSSELDTAFLELLDAKSQSINTARETVRLNNRSVQALVMEITYDEFLIPSAVADRGGFRAFIRVADVPKKPVKFTKIGIRQQTLSILSVIDINGVIYELMAGDVMAEDH